MRRQMIGGGSESRGKPCSGRKVWWKRWKKVEEEVAPRGVGGTVPDAKIKRERPENPRSAGCRTAKEF
jgi:hypothetical protein